MGECCRNAQLGFKDVPDVMDKLKGWIATGSINMKEYFDLVNAWCNTDDTQYYRQGTNINRSVSPALLNKLTKESSNCLAQTH